MQDSQSAKLFRWNGNSFDPTPLDNTRYRFDSGADATRPTSHIPFSLLGITDPPVTPFTLAALASKKLAAAVGDHPAQNPVSSDRVVKTGVFAGADYSFSYCACLRLARPGAERLPQQSHRRVAL